MKIATVRGMNFEVPNDAWWSFYNSPYPAHKLGTAVDVYFPEKALFPLEEGIVEGIKKVRTPAHVPIREDYVMIFRIGEFCLKVLHVKPTVKVGEKVALGDEIGEMTVSGFYMPWSDRHVHFELRSCENPYRARGAFQIRPELLRLVPTAEGREFEVVERRENYCWIVPTRRGKENLTPIAFNDHPIEGGLPHYHYGAVFGNTEKVRVLNVELPAQQISSGASIFRADFEIMANGEKAIGVGIYCNQEKLKLVGGNFEEGEIIVLTVFPKTRKSRRVY
ncbi:hypothetical protein TON_0299 [Thermococcus onnurineus NA1]|uniref:Peptidase M23 domain-containing protein n=1 Tax=Thermococcus onnurineus (strain NA1) TaxID=523850 RepID=B6YT97_THEON|nr:hypothetical protein [Thermococcus onnurineus]ACJ15784.1 hypothetical protein TON_0299 [Thermococcus onnurineus NA1]